MGTEKAKLSDRVQGLFGNTALGLDGRVVRLQTLLDHAPHVSLQLAKVITDGKTHGSFLADGVRDRWSRPCSINSFV